MSYFVIMSSEANLVESFDDEGEARAALDALARSEPESADEYALLTYGDDGHPTGEALLASELHAPLRAVQQPQGGLGRALHSASDPAADPLGPRRAERVIYLLV